MLSTLSVGANAVACHWVGRFAAPFFIPAFAYPFACGKLRCKAGLESILPASLRHGVHPCLPDERAFAEAQCSFVP